MFSDARVKKALQRHYKDLLRLDISGANYLPYIGAAAKSTPWERRVTHLDGSEGLLAETRRVR